MRPEWGTSLVFAASGTVQASWFSRLPAIRDQIHADLAGIGIALTALGTGTLVAMAVAGVACRRFGPRRVVSCATVIGCVSLAAVGGVRSFAQLVGVLLVFGLAIGAWDGAMNIQGVAVERANKLHWMSLFHGWWSVGSVVGAGLGVAAAKLGVPIAVHLGAVAILTLIVGLQGAFGSADGPPAADKVPGRHRLGIVAVLILVGATIEGAAGDWLAIFLGDHHGFTRAGASAGYAVFVVALAVGRFAATVSHRVIGIALTVRIGAAVAALGVIFVVFPSAVEMAMVGAALWGLGICGVFPAALSASGNSGSDDSVAAMTSIGYGAGVVGPIIISTLAGARDLGTALLVLPWLAVILIVFARHLGRQEATSDGDG